MQEPKTNMESRVFSSFSDVREDTAFANKERRLKGMDAGRVNNVLELKCVKAKKNAGLKHRSVICKFFVSCY